MLLDLSTLSGERDHVERCYGAARFEPAEADYRVASEVVLSLDVHKTGRQVRLVGSLVTRLELVCGRCLEPFAWPVDARFDLVYVPAAENVGEGEIEVGEDDLDVAFYQGEVIDLAQLIREQCYLALPMKPLCTPGCRGLCPECGTNRNTAACACQPRWEDPRLAALKSLLERERSDA